MNLLWRRTLPICSIISSIRQELSKKCMHNVVHKNVNITSTNTLFPQTTTILYSTNRYKSKKQRDLDSDDEDESFDDDSSLSRDSKVVKFNTTTLRTDTILKSALGVARKKIEQMFYESKIRVNGTKIMKKSASVKTGDEIDVIKMVSPKNSDHLYVARVEILNIAAKGENITISARRFKNLLIENYPEDPHKGTAESSE
ncbi:uncharacterized protein LOC128672518 [Plodia interpunctella]|uniref:uncharacterized protein LOC128672518 n=1 Tax=Plodia interpunctella TaxID=58824 RepID=UPI0023677EA1|nr:uncharacterized protein LOC128672518 [Plodia interpunctella]